MLSRPQVTVLIALAFLAVWLVDSLQGGRIPFGMLFSTLSGVVGILMLVLIAFDLWLWRIPFLYPWLVARPDIGGEWSGELRSLWKNPATGEGVPPISVAMSIHQTYSDVEVALSTSESRSELLGAKVNYTPSGAHSVVAVYLNVPRLEVRDRSAIHYGAVVLNVDGRRPDELKASYWTDRDSKGEISFRRK